MGQELLEYFPLVSVVVITYNSEKYVIETLESAKNQSYRNLELIISDDCSQDNTLDVCKNWLISNKYRFIRTVIVSVKSNTGIAPNCNRGLKVSRGEWVKVIAGDDILIETCISDFVNFTNKNRDAKVIFGRSKILKFNEIIDDYPLDLFCYSNNIQLKKILKGSGLKAPTSFINKSILDKVGGFDEKFKLLEDFPLWIKLSQLGYRFYTTDSFTVIYRIHDSNISINRKADSIIANIDYYKDVRSFFIEVLNPILLRSFMIRPFFNNLNEILVNDVIILLGNKHNILTRFLRFLNLKLLKSYISVEFKSLLNKFISNAK